MQITRGGVTVQPLTFQFGVVLLSGGGTTTGGTTTGGTTTGGTTIGGGDGGGDMGSSGFLSGVGGVLLGLLTLGGIAASTPPPTVPPAVTAGPAVTAPSAAPPAPAAVAATPPASAPGGRATPAPIVLAASAAQTNPAVAPNPSKQGPGVVLPYTGANLWLPFAAGSGLIGFGVWLRRFAERLTEE